MTVLINISIWDHHASPFGIGCLFVCLAGAAAYQQAWSPASYRPPHRAQHSVEEFVTRRATPILDPTPAPPPPRCTHRHTPSRDQAPMRADSTKNETTMALVGSATLEEEEEEMADAGGTFSQPRN